MDNYIIADNQDITKAGMMFLLLHQKSSINNLYEAINKKELINLMQLHTHALVVLDYTLFDFTEVSELLALHERFKNISWLLFSDDLSKEFLNHILVKSESFSVLMKDASQEEIYSAIQNIQKGERYICNHVSNMFLPQSQNKITHEDQLLTITEKAILKEIASGKTTKEIANERNLSFHTVNSHRKNIFRKLEVNNVHEATKYAVRAGIVDLAEYFI